MAAEGGESSSSSSDSNQAPEQPKGDKSESAKQAEVEGSHESVQTTSSESAAKDVTPALGTPADERKYGSGGKVEDMKSPKESSGGDRKKVFASPLARKIALEQGIPLAQVKGTGPEGRITKSDVESYKPSAPASSSSSSAASSSKSAPAPAQSSASAEYEDVPASSMRKIIGQRLLESKTQVPHYYVTVEVNMGASA